MQVNSPVYVTRPAVIDQTDEDKTTNGNKTNVLFKQGMVI